MRLSAKQLNKQVRFVVVGGVNTLLGLALFPVLYLIFGDKADYLVILIISQITCISVSYLGNKLVVFKTKGWVLSEYLKFWLLHGLIIGLNLMALPFMVEHLEFNPMVAQAAFALVVVVASYFWHDKVTFTEVV